MCFLFTVRSFSQELCKALGDTLKATESTREEYFEGQPQVLQQLGRQAQAWSSQCVTVDEASCGSRGVQLSCVESPGSWDVGGSIPTAVVLLQEACTSELMDPQVLLLLWEVKHSAQDASGTHLGRHWVYLAPYCCYLKDIWGI